MVTTHPRGTVKVTLEPSGVSLAFVVDQGVIRQLPRRHPPKRPLRGELHAVGEDGERRLVIEECVIAAEPQAPAELPRPVGVLDELVAHDAHRVAELDLLDGRVLGVLRIGLDGVGPVFPDAGRRTRPRGSRGSNNSGAAPRAAAGRTRRSRRGIASPCPRRTRDRASPGRWPGRRRRSSAPRPPTRRPRPPDGSRWRRSPRVRAPGSLHRNPAFIGRSGSVRQRTKYAQDENVCAKVEFIGARRWGLVPDRSNVIPSSSITTARPAGSARP